MADYWFFLSYARGDAKGNPWVQQFYEELAQEVRIYAGLGSGPEIKEIGFFDQEGIEIPFPHRTVYSGSITEPFPIKLCSENPVGSTDDATGDSKQAG